MGDFMKKLVSVILAAVIAASVCTAPASAKSASDTMTGIADSFNGFFGSVACTFHKIINKIKRTDETQIPTPAVQPGKAVPSQGIPDVDPSQSAVKAQTWRAVELEFTSAKEYADPFSDVTLDLILTDGNIQYTIPAFWDGRNVWKARVACPAAGRWYYRTVCSDTENTSLETMGVIDCEKYSGSLDIYNYGFVSVREGKKYFTYDDGTPFFYLGDTHWSLGDETADMVREIAAKRAEQRFTVWQSEPIGAQFDVSNGVTQADIEGFRSYDEKFRIIADAGLVHANASFFFPSYMGILIQNFGGYSEKTITGKIEKKNVTVNDLADSVKIYLEKLSRYWVARYGAYPVIWTLGQETDNDFYWNSENNHPQWNALNNPYKLVAQYTAKYDAYSHPLSAHQENTGATAAYGTGEGTGEKLKKYCSALPSAFRGVSEHNFYAAQWNPSKTGRYDADIVKDYWYNSQGKPSINYEGQYCYLWTKNFGARMQGWLAYLNGLYGCAWGGQDTWSYLNIYNENEDSSDGVDTITSAEKTNATWRDSLEYPSTYQIGFMRSFLEEGRWWELIPRFDNKSFFMPQNGVYSVCAANSDVSEIVIYFYSFTDASIAANANTGKNSGAKTGTVGQLKPKAEYTYQWFNPVTGEYGESGTFTSSLVGTHFIGSKPSDTEWAIRITKN